MKLITYYVEIHKNIDDEIKDYKEIENIKEIMINACGIPIDNKRYLIDYRLKNKEYNIFDWEETERPIYYNIELEEEEK